MMNKDIFSEFVGQSRVKNVLRFCLDCYKTSNYFAPLCVSAKRGDGKTYLCSLVAKELKKPHILINSSTVKSVTALVDEIIMPVATGSTNGGTLHFDESHFLNKGKGNGSIEGFLLSCIQPAKNHINTVQYAGGTLSIDTKKISFLFSTTNLENHGQAFLNRLRKISFAPYEVSDLEKIIKNNAEGIHFSPKLVHEIATVCRDTPRTAVLMANDIVSYTEITKNKQFTKFPARLRNYNIIQPIVKLLLGEKEELPNEPIVFNVNSNSPSEEDDEFNRLLGENLAQQFINEMNGAGMETGMENKEVLPYEKLKENYENSARDNRTLIAQEAMDYLKYWLDLEKRNRDAFRYWLITGHVYSLRYLLKNDIIRDIVDPREIYHTNDSLTGLIEDCSAVTRVTRYSINNIMRNTINNVININIYNIS
jgi:Holliday junction resolvasome RuvABC ATP-dependent DNA helicase subunit